MKANDNIKSVFENYGTNVLVISDYEIDDGYDIITYVVLDGSNLLLYNGNPDLGKDFQDDDYEQLFLEDDDDKWTEIKEAIMSL
jgi:hypothetical protein